MNIKNLLKFIIFLIPWFFSIILFKIDKGYYFGLNKPFFAPMPIVFAIVWPILYILITISVYNNYKKEDVKYKFTLLVNYISNQLFTYFLFTDKNLFLSLVDTIIILLSSFILYKNTNNKKAYLIPYIIWNVYALILIFSVYIMN